MAENLFLSRGPILVPYRGLPGSGKTTHATLRLRRLTAAGILAARVSRDDVRAMLGLDATVNTDRVTRTEHTIIRGLFLTGTQVVIEDSTNLDPDRLRLLYDLAEEHGAAVEVIDLRHVPVEECIARDALRTGTARVGAQVIRRMAAGWIHPAGAR